MVTASQINDGLKLEPLNKITLRVLGKRVAPATAWRWIHKGTKGGKLRATHLGGKWLTTSEDFADFLNRQTEAAYRQHAEHCGESSDADDDDDALRAAGLL